MKMTLEWLRMWQAYFRRNPDFEDYCRARRDSDAGACKQLESNFERIAELYDDWGDIHDPRFIGGLQAYEAWLKGRRHLFFRKRTVSRIDDPLTYVEKPGHLLIDVPLSEKMSEVMAVVESYLTLVYSMRTDVIERNLPVSKAVMQLPVPKYVLHAPSGTLNAATMGALEKAWYVDSFRHLRPDGKPLSITDTVLAIKQDQGTEDNPGNPMGWTMTPDDDRAVARGTFAKSILGGSEVTLIKRHRKDFDAYVRNTIHGRFPDNS